MVHAKNILLTLAVILIGLAALWTIVRKPSSRIAEMLTGKTLAEQHIYWLSRIRKIGGVHAFEELKMRESGNNHPIAHTFGEAVYDELGINGVGVCDDTFEYGCYHGFFGRAIGKEGASVIAKFDAACRKTWRAKYLPCHHGIGHGIITYTGSDHLLEALKICKTISTQPTGGCVSGVFMGYNFQNFDHSGRVQLRPLDDADPQLPCAILPREFLSSCYAEQPQWWIAALSGDVKKVGMLCTGAPPEAQDACFHGMGNYIAPLTQYDVDRTIAFCSEMPTYNGRIWCQEGASLVFLSQPAVRARAKAVCNGLEPDAKTVCVQKLTSNPFWEE